MTPRSSEKTARTQRIQILARAIDPARAAEVAGRLPAAVEARNAHALILATAYDALAPACLLDPSAIPEPRSIARRQLASALRRSLGSDTSPTDAPSADSPTAEPLADFGPRLRRFALEHKLRIALRELLPVALGGADFETTAAELSDLADVTIEAALEEAKGAVMARTGVPRSPDGTPGELVVLGMGKLGGRELNAGSDVDLVCFYDSDEHVARAESGQELSAHEVWTRVVKRMTATLADVTAEGFVWRVDLRLRPEGARGPLVNSLAAAERYYEDFGRLWERSAWLRARPVAGDLGFGERVLEALAPFIWSRRVDPSIAQSMYELVHRARQELSPAPERDLKLGPGGIREAEFFVQALQLIWGGREPRVRVRSTLDAIQRLRAAGLVSEREADDLAAGYVALRRAEHALQWQSGVQTHSLPTDGHALERLARALGFAESGAFLADLEAHERHIGELLRSLLPGDSRETPRWNDALLALDREDLAAFSAALGAAGMPDADEEHGQLVRDLFEAARLHPDVPLGARSRERWRHLADSLLEAVADAADPPQAARFFRGFSARVRPAAVYTKLLADEPAALRRLVTVLGGSAFVGQLVATRPEVADLVLFEHALPTAADARREMEAAWRASSADDVEEAVGAIRRAHTRVVTQVALADLAGELDIHGVTDVLSALADAAIEVSARIALGLPRDGRHGVKGLAIIAMGKLGGREIAYGSDLDVLFLFDPQAVASGADPVAHFTKSARRIIHLLGMPHPEGPGYELDTRLRPSGNQGLLVASLPAFARYHHVGDHGAQGAATWERLALLRARFAAGDPEVGRAAIAIAHEAAYSRRGLSARPLPNDGGSPDQPAAVAAIAAEVHRLRERLERELARERPGRYDIKLGRGGLMDIEFAVQLLQLMHAHRPEVRTSDTRVALEALTEIGALPPDTAEALREGHTFLRRLQQRIRVVHGDDAHLIEESAHGLVPLARRMGIRTKDGARAAHVLVERYRATAERVRSAYESIVVTPFRRDDGGLDAAHDGQSG